MKYWYLIVVFATISGITNSYGQRVNALIDSIANTFMADSTAYGLAIGTIDNGTISTFYYGGKTQKTVQDIDSLSIFEIGSVTKLYTAYILSSLEQDGILSRYDLLSKYLTEGLAEKKVWKNKVKLIDLATHTSGFPSMDNTKSLMIYDNFDENDPFNLFTKDFMFSSLESIDSIPNYGKVVYSNFGIGLLGGVVEKASGKSYKELLEQYLQNPLKLSSTYLHIPESEISNLALPHRNNEVMPLIQLYELEASGIIKTSLPDLLKFLSIHLEPKTEKQKSVVNSVLSNQLENSETKVGIGWGIYPVEGMIVNFHNGGTYGSSSVVIIIPEINSGVAILANHIDSGRVTAIGLKLIKEIITAHNN